jgi:hypothetical protein
MSLFQSGKNRVKQQALLNTEPSGSAGAIGTFQKFLRCLKDFD